MNRIFAPLLFFTLLLLGGCIFPPQKQLRKTVALVEKAQHLGALELAPAEYAAAAGALDDAQRLIQRRKYRRAAEALQLSRGHARRAIGLSETASEEQQATPPTAEDQSATPAPPPPAKPRPARVEPKPAPPAPKPVEPPPLPAQYTVRSDENLWLVAARQEVYGNPLLWPLLYRANRDQIRDPRQIYAGQILDIPRDISSAEHSDAIERARTSDIFPVESPLRSSSDQPALSAPK